jgi:hypothetical protein
MRLPFFIQIGAEASTSGSSSSFSQSHSVSFSVKPVHDQWPSYPPNRVTTNTMAAAPIAMYQR